MKKSLFALSIVALFFSSCKKDETTEFTATDVTGTSTLKGYATKNIVVRNSSNTGWTAATMPASGAVVQVKVNKGGNGGLYPNGSTNLGADVYSATTDANGYYSISFKSNSQGVTAWYTFVGFTGTHDTLVNNTTKTGPAGYYWGDTDTWGSLVMGQTYEQNYDYGSPSITNGNPNNIDIGQATVTGTIGMQLVLKTAPDATTAPVFGTTVVPVPAGITVYMSLNKDPYLLANKVYTTTTNANGAYTFSNFATVASGTSNFSQNANIWVADYVAVQDTHIVINNVITAAAKAGVPGVYNNSSTNQNALYNNEFRNSANFNFAGFTND
jgi:hypothetical protein